MIYIIGGGPAGRMAAIRLAASGKEVTIIEKRMLGGQCVHDGCMLICGLNDAARSIRNAQFLKKSGVIDGEISVRYPDVIEKLMGVQSKLAHILERETLQAGAQVMYGVTAEIKDGRLFADGKECEAEAVIIAAGGQMNIPDIEGNNLLGTYTARTIKTMKTLPKHIVIIGGGISAAEFAYIYSAFGAKVTILARSLLLSVLPEKIMKSVRRDLSDVEIIEHANVERIIGDEKVCGVAFNGKTIDCDAVIFAAGINPISPYVSGLEKNEDGSIKVNEYMETSVKGIYAAGDITGRPYFTPVARLQGFAAADAILGHPRKIDLSQVPFCVVLGYDYTVCPAKEDGTTYSSYNIAGPNSFWHVADGSIGSMHLSVDDETGKLLGFASAAPAAGIVGTYLGYLIRKGVTTHDFSEMLEVHPISEGLYSLIRLAEK